MQLGLNGPHRLGRLTDVLVRQRHARPAATGGGMRISDRLERRPRFRTRLLDEPAARREDASGRQLVDARDRARDRDQRPLLRGRIEVWHATEQVERVGVQWPLEQLVQERLLHELTGVHDADPVADLGDHSEIVRDVEDGRVELSLEVGHEVKHHRLRRHVQRGRRLIHDEQCGVGHQRHGDHAALEHPARELMRVTAHDRLGVGHGDLGQHLGDPAQRLRFVHAEVLTSHLRELSTDDYRRVEGAEGALVHDADARAPEGSKLSLRQFEELDPVEAHAAVGDAAVLRQVADRAHGESGLARPGLADEAEALVLVHTERYVAHCVQHAQLGLVVDAQSLDLEHGSTIGGHGGGGAGGDGGVHVSSSRRRAT